MCQCRNQWETNWTRARSRKENKLSCFPKELDRMFAGISQITRNLKSIADRIAKREAGSRLKRNFIAFVRARKNYGNLRVDPVQVDRALERRFGMEKYLRSSCTPRLKIKVHR